MRRVALLLLGLALLVAATLLEEAPAPVTGGGLEALGRSLGGWRVVAVNALFLRAEALRAAGRADELAAFYGAIVDFDPDNDAAIDALAREQVDNLLPTAPTPEARLGWWLEAWRQVERGLVANPTSARLMFRAGDLLLQVPAHRPELAPGIDAALGGAPAREALGVGWLLAAARTTAHLPKAGRLHLLALARTAPLLAARALVAGRPPREVAALLSAGAELLTLHPDVLADMPEDVVVAEGPPREAPLARVLATAVEAVHAALALAEGGSRALFEDALAAHVEAAGETPLAAALRAWARTR